MGFPDIPMPDQEESYIPSEDVVAFLNSYAAKFHINDHIKFEHNVIRIKPKGDWAWEVRSITKDYKIKWITSYCVRR